MTKNKEKLVKVEAVCTSMTGEFRDTNEDNFYFNGKYMDSDGGIALRLTSGEPEEVEPEEDELSEEMLQIIEESYREAEENGEIPDFDDFDVAELLEDNPIGEILHAPEADVSGKWVAVFDGIGGLHAVAHDPEQVGKLEQLLADHEAEPRLSDLSFQNAFVPGVPEQLEEHVVALGEPIFQRNVVDQVFLQVLVRIGIGTDFASDHRFQPIVEQTFGQLIGVVGPVAATAGRLVVVRVDSEAQIDALEAVGRPLVQLFLDEVVQRVRRVGLGGCSGTRVSIVYQQVHCLSSPLLGRQGRQLVLHGQILRSRQIERNR